MYFCDIGPTDPKAKYCSAYSYIQCSLPNLHTSIYSPQHIAVIVIHHARRSSIQSESSPHWVGLGQRGMGRYLAPLPHQPDVS